jgi:hypothetical protein
MTEQAAPTGHIYSRKDFTWGECLDGWALHAIGHRSAIVHVVPDGVWPGMWRIRHPDGRLSDMANLTWVKDGAIAMAMRLLDPRRRTEQRLPGGPPMRPEPVEGSAPPSHLSGALGGAAGGALAAPEAFRGKRDGAQ